VHQLSDFEPSSHHDVRELAVSGVCLAQLLLGETERRAGRVEHAQAVRDHAIDVPPQVSCSSTPHTMEAAGSP
jgi:hypothetical protein